MNNTDHTLNGLRKKAEAVIRSRPPVSEINFSEAEIFKILQENELQKIELELQQEHFTEVLKEKEKIQKEYNELSDLHDRFIQHFLKHGGFSGNQ